MKNLARWLTLLLLVGVLFGASGCYRFGHGGDRRGGDDRRGGHDRH